MNCPECGWPNAHGHSRECRLVARGGDVRRYKPGSEQLPELCAVEYGDGPEPLAFVSLSAGADLSNHVALPFPVYLGLWRRAYASGNPAPLEERLAGLEKAVAHATFVAATGTAAIERFTRALEKEQAVTDLCLECDGRGFTSTHDGADESPQACAPCDGTGRAR